MSAFVKTLVTGLSLSALGTGTWANTSCQAQSAATQIPVIELYTSEGCDSCPPADRWLSQLKAAAAEGKVVAQAFHVGYWDYLGWVDRFAAASHTTRQREIAAINRLSSIYTPQVVRNGLDWRGVGANWAGRDEPARVSIEIKRNAADAFEATVNPSAEVANWAAYWTVTEHDHVSKVKAGENAGATLKHDFVVRQYVQAGSHKGVQKLSLRTVATEGQHPRQVNLVVFDHKSGKPLQALSLACTG